MATGRSNLFKIVVNNIIFLNVHMWHNIVYCSPDVTALYRVHTTVRIHRILLFFIVGYSFSTPAANEKKKTWNK